MPDFGQCRLLRELIADPTTVITRGSTYDNRANPTPRTSTSTRGHRRQGMTGRREFFYSIKKEGPPASFQA
jgi:hypothetical protein